MLRNSDTLPELITVDERDPAGAKRIRRLAAQGRLRRLRAGVYTSNLDAPLITIVLRPWQPLVGHLLPGGVVYHRSAFDGKPYEVTTDRTRSQWLCPSWLCSIELTSHDNDRVCQVLRTDRAPSALSHARRLVLHISGSESPLKLARDPRDQRSRHAR